MIEEYIESNKLKRTQLVIDIKNGRINKGSVSNIMDELEDYVRRGKVENPYIETKELDIRRKSEWSKNYLDYLISQVSSAEIFNRELVEYISVVSEYVNSANKRMLKKVLSILLSLCAFFCAGYITGRKNIENIDVLKKEIANLSNELLEVKNKNIELSNENSTLKDLNENLSNQVLDFKSRFDTLQTESKQISVSSETKETDDLAKFIERALRGENVKSEFNASKYNSLQVEERALEMGLKRRQAQLLMDNLVNPKKFDINKFSE